jgi:hypothetical protein
MERGRPATQGRVAPGVLQAHWVAAASQHTDDALPERYQVRDSGSAIWLFGDGKVRRPRGRARRAARVKRRACGPELLRAAPAGAPPAPC